MTSHIKANTLREKVPRLASVILVSRTTKPKPATPWKDALAILLYASQGARGPSNVEITARATATWARIKTETSHYLFTTLSPCEARVSGLGTTPYRRGLVGWRAPVLRCRAAWRTEPSRPAVVQVPALSLFALVLRYSCTTFLDLTSGHRGSVGKNIAVWGLAVSNWTSDKLRIWIPWRQFFDFDSLPRIVPFQNLW